MPTDRSRIEQWSIWYYSLKLYIDLLFKRYFRITITGKKNIPDEGIHIFVLNHQNALIDALAVLCLYRNWQPVFLARADIFRQPTVRKILTFLKILPIYRIRDGFENLNKNDEVFNKTQDVLRNGNGLVILPEGNHYGAKRLRPLKKGVARIAFQTEEASEYSLNINIIPVGLDYTDYTEFGSKLLVRIGTPFRLNNLTDLYKENPARAYNALLKHIERGLKSEMIHINDEQYYEPIKMLLDVFVGKCLSDKDISCKHTNIVEGQQHFIRELNKYRKDKPDDFLLLMASSLEYINLKKKHGLLSEASPNCSAKMFCSVFIRLLTTIVTLPLFLYSFINSAIPLAIPYYVSKKSVDMQFHSSVRLVVGAIAFPIIHGLQVLAFALLANNWLLTLGYALSLPLSLLFFFWWKRFAVKTISIIKEKTLRFRKPGDHKRLNELYSLLGERVDRIQSPNLLEKFSGYLSG